MIGYADLNWKDNKLYHGKKDTSVYLVKDDKHEFMYWINWDFEKPQESANFYSLTNAKDNGKKLYLQYINGDTENDTTEART